MNAKTNYSQPIVNNLLANYSDQLKGIVGQISRQSLQEWLCQISTHELPMPSISTMNQVIQILRGILFPGFYGDFELNETTTPYHTGASIDQLIRLLSDQVMRGFCFTCQNEISIETCQIRSREKVMQFLARLPGIQRVLITDVQAAYKGDPAARSSGEVIFCYPSIKALLSYRVAHELHQLGIPIIPRLITEMAHSETGVDIHPGAQIGESFFVDHGTGVVIGETTIIGNNVRIYQGVTLGAKKFPTDSQGNLIKGIPRHPIVEDQVIIYSGATLLGRITIGKNSVIGGNVWITENVPPNSQVLQREPREIHFEGGGGI